MSRTYRMLLGVVVIAATAGAYWMFLLAPKRKEAADISTKVSIARAQLVQAKTTLADYAKSKSEYRDNYARYIRLGKAVPADDDTRSLMVQVDAAAKRSGIDFDNIDLVASGGPAAGSNVATAQSTTGLPPGAVNAGSFSIMPFSLAFTGEFASLSNFFSRLERFVTVDGEKIAVDGRLLRVETLDLKPLDGGWPAIRANVGVTAYVVPSTPDATTGATPQGPAGAGTTTTPGTSTSTSGTTTTTSGTTTSTSGSDLR